MSKLRSKENANVAFALLLEHAKPARIIGLGNAGPGGGTPI